MNTITITKQTLLLFLISSLVLGLLPYVANAQRPQVEGNFCENIYTLRDEAGSRLDKKHGESDRSGDYETKKAERMLNLEAKRLEADQKREDRFDELRERTEGSDKDEAVEDFVETVEGLVETRRAAVDAAIEDFESAVESLLDERKDAIDDVKEDLEADIDAIFDTAEEACEDEEPPREVREEFQAGMKDLREEFKGQRGEYNFRDELASARDDRKAAVEAAREAFRADLESAKADLRAALEV